jgi:hypothetical protein
VTNEAKEAARILAEPLLDRAMAAVRQEALDALAVTDPTDSKEISRLQAIANCLPEVRNWLEAQIIKAQTSGFDPNEPTG